jgi:CBS domain-containing protein
MSTVRKLLEVKGGDVWRIDPNDTVLNALRLMEEKNIGALMVVEKEQLVGIISERDYARKVALEGRSTEGTKVREIMTRRIYSVLPETTLQHCMRLMTEKRIRHLPVVDDNQLIGVVSIGDVVREIISNQETLIQILESSLGSRRIPTF